MADIAKAIVAVYSLFHRSEFRYPVEGEENSRYMSFKEKMWFAYKILGRPMERAEKGKGIEEFFASQDLRFAPPEGFQEASSTVISAGGDLLASRNISAANAARFWDEAEDFIFCSDLCCANLETPVVPSIPPTYVPGTLLKEIALNNAEEMFDIFYRDGAGIKLFTTANNHALDMGPEGVALTLEFLEKKGCLHVGTALSEEERDSFPVIEKNGIRTAFLSHTYSLNKKVLPEGREYLANYQRLNLRGADLSLLEAQVRMARQERQADLVIACLHFSTEFDSYPLQSTIDMAHRVMELGVDVIIGNHAHTVQPLEKYRYADPLSGREKEGLIVYALGDLVTPTEWRGMINSRLNNLLRLKVSKGTLNGAPMTVVSDLKIRPMYIHNTVERGKSVDYRLRNLTTLRRELARGTNRLNLDQKTVSEVKRLGALAEKLLPSDLIG